MEKKSFGRINKGRREFLRGESPMCRGLAFPKAKTALNQGHFLLQVQKKRRNHFSGKEEEHQILLYKDF